MLYEKIIAVDDRPNILESIRITLHRHFEVICFNKGREALAFLRKSNNIKLVLLDIVMEPMDGLSVLREIKKINKDIIVVMITAYGSKEFALEALQGHADDFIDKPFDLDELQKKIRRLLKERAGPGNERAHDIEQMKRFIERNYHDISLRHMSDEMNLNIKHTSRLFRNRYKCSFREYKTKVKMDKAKTLLKNSSYTVCQVAEILVPQQA